MIKSTKIYPIVIEGTTKKQGKTWQCSAFSHVVVTFEDGTICERSTISVLSSGNDTKTDSLQDSMKLATLEGTSLVTEIVNDKIKEIVT